MPRYRDHCQGRVSVPITPTLRIEARCMLHEGHGGDCAADATRWRLRWSAPEVVGVSEEVGDA